MNIELERQLKTLRMGVEELIPEEDFVKKLERSIKEKKPLRVKYGIDPTGYDVHIGHLVPIRKMREFQDLGHLGIIIIGDYTAQIGDPTGRIDSRSPLSEGDVHQNAEKYMDQLFIILDRSRTEVRWQTEWFSNWTLSEILKTLSNFTLAQFMAHDTFRNRFEKGHALGMHEILYPVLQGYDSVAIEADVELGATEQKFNILFGRDMQRLYGQEEQVACLSPILMGTDGANKMSKSLNNYIAVFDPPEEKYGKTMSIPDELILHYFTYATTLSAGEIQGIERQMKKPGTNPMGLKKRLAREIVKLYHGEKAAGEAERGFERVFSRREIPEEIPVATFRRGTKIWVPKLITDKKLTPSTSEARRTIQQGGVSIDGKRITDVGHEVTIDREMIIKVGKRRFLKVVPE